MLSLIPARFAVAVLFVVSCFVSTAMGTSVGTITLITPIAVAVATASGVSLPLCIASVMGGAMFGDNLSFISDTTIAACQGQGCEMKDKFRENFAIALPAAILTLVLILVISLRSEIAPMELPPYNLVQIIPYVLVLAGADRAELEEEKRRSFEDMPLEEHMEMYIAQGLSRKEAMKKVAADRGVSKRDIYKELL